MVTCKSIVTTLFSYETPKIVQIKSVLVGVISRVVQLAILGYIIGYVLVYKKGYQEFSEVESAVTTKVKGVAFTNFPDDRFKPEIKHPDWYRRVWDVTDLVVPPSENGATFIATNVVITQNQTLGVCPEDPSIEGAKCDPYNNTCTDGESLLTGNGVMTGKCVPVDEKSGNHSCQIHAWCPVEDDTLPLKNNSALIEDSRNFTILIKNFVNFPKFTNSSRRNIKDTSDSTYLKSCIYDSEHTDCPIFRLGDIVEWSGQDFESIASQGGVIAVVINWDCNLDFDKKYCFPTYSFNRLDNPEAKLAPGWNFRYANYYTDDSRTLYKLFGIRLSILVTGQAGKFRIIPLLLNVGAGLGLLALEVVVCDIVVLYLSRNRSYFKSKKYEEVDPNNASFSSVPEVSVVDPTPPIMPKKRDQGDGYERLED